VGGHYSPRGRAFYGSGEMAFAFVGGPTSGRSFWSRAGGWSAIRREGAPPTNWVNGFCFCGRSDLGAKLLIWGGRLVRYSPRGRASYGLGGRLLLLWEARPRAEAFDLRRALGPLFAARARLLHVSQREEQPVHSAEIPSRQCRAPSSDMLSSCFSLFQSNGSSFCSAS